MLAHSTSPSWSSWSSVVVAVSASTLRCVTNVSLSKSILCWIGRTSSMLLERSLTFFRMHLCSILFLLGHRQYRRSESTIVPMPRKGIATGSAFCYLKKTRQDFKYNHLIFLFQPSLSILSTALQLLFPTTRRLHDVWEEYDRADSLKYTSVQIQTELTTCVKTLRHRPLYRSSICTIRSFIHSCFSSLSLKSFGPTPYSNVATYVLSFAYTMVSFLCLRLFRAAPLHRTPC
jgi:hypothetical protein